MPINRSVKPLVRTQRLRCPRRSGRLDQVAGLRLLTLPDRSRNAVVERARLLVQDPGYPPPYVLKSVADLIARHVRV